MEEWKKRKWMNGEQCMGKGERNGGRWTELKGRDGKERWR